MHYNSYLVKATDALSISGKTRVTILVTVLAILGLFLYREALSDLIASVLHREDASHGLCVPFISGYLIWLRLEKITKAKLGFDPVPGMVMTGAGLLLFFLLGDSKEIAVAAFSFLLVAAGLVVGLFGRNLFKELCFPLFFLVTMIPLPKPVYAQLTEWMRMATTAGAVWVVRFFPLSIYREGYHITLPNINLFVANACSGIRYLIPYFVFGLAYAFVCKKTIKSRILVVLATIPIAIGAGILRQSVIFLSAYYISPVMAEHRPHVMISWSVFLTVLAGAIWLDQWISKSTGQTAMVACTRFKVKGVRHKAHKTV